jgi:hypothetical protein
VCGDISLKKQEINWWFKKEFAMRPTYYGLLQLNPLLQSRGHGEIKDLIGTIGEYGCTWDPKQKRFYNSEISVGIKLQGLHLLTPEQFKEDHNHIRQEHIADPDQHDKRSYGDSDSLFGYQSGIKNILVSAILGIIVVGILFPGITVQQANKFIIIAVGYPIWLVLRRLYWNHRFNQIINFIANRNYLSVEEQTNSLQEYTPKLYYAI